MSISKIKWMAAIPYLLLLLIVINGNILGNYELYFFGVQLSLITLIPYLIYHFVNKNHDNEFIALHTKMAMGIFFKYFLLTAILSIILNVMGFGVIISNPFVIFGAGAIGMLLMLPLFIVVVYTLVVATKGSIKAFKLIQPNGSEWVYKKEAPVVASNT